MGKLTATSMVTIKGTVTITITIMLTARLQLYTIIVRLYGHSQLGYLCEFQLAGLHQALMLRTWAHSSSTLGSGLGLKLRLRSKPTFDTSVSKFEMLPFHGH